MTHQNETTESEGKRLGLEPLYTISELADYLSVSRATVYRLLNDGSIKAVRVGQGVRFTRSNVQDFLASCEVDNAL